MVRRVQAAHRIVNSLNVTITNWDWHKFTKRRYNDTDFVFVDPPYFGCHPGAYDPSAFDHPGFVEWLKRARFRWMLTEYRQDFYVKAFGEPSWTKKVQVAMAGARRWSAVECVWTNYGTGSKSGRKGPSQP